MRGEVFMLIVIRIACKMPSWETTLSNDWRRQEQVVDEGISDSIKDSIIDSEIWMKMKLGYRFVAANGYELSLITVNTILSCLSLGKGVLMFARNPWILWEHIILDMLYESPSSQPIFIIFIALSSKYP